MLTINHCVTLFRLCSSNIQSEIMANCAFQAEVLVKLATSLPGIYHL